MNRITNAELQALLKSMTPQQKIEFLEELEEQQRRLQLRQARGDMLSFAKEVYPGFKEGAHHRKLSKIFADVASGNKKRVIINIAPRMGEIRVCFLFVSGLVFRAVPRAEDHYGDPHGWIVRGFWSKGAES
jgi:hypothetical protein